MGWSWGLNGHLREAAFDEVQEQGVGRLQSRRQLLGAGPSFLAFAVCDVPGIPFGVCAATPTAFIHSFVHSEHHGGNQIGQALLGRWRVLTEKQSLPGRGLNKVVGRHSQDLEIPTGKSVWYAMMARLAVDADARFAYLHDAGYLLHLALPWEERVAGVELGQDAAQTPHVDGHAVRVTQDDLWGAVEATLDVGVHCWK